jgi:NTP pyrophosphatase (non-canonical NTP hydrolase)
MHISEYQRWLKEYDVARDFHLASPAHTFIHFLEEIGEVARLVLYAEGYRDPAGLADWRARLAEELADAATFLFKLAYQYDIDLESALLANMTKAEGRFDVESGRADTQRYLASQVENLRKRKGTDAT